MTISTAPTPLSYSGNGSTVAFPITWKYNSTTHVVATLRSSTGTETVWVVTTNYTITAAGDTGTLTAVVAPATGETLVITLEPPNTQSSDIPLGGDFPSVTVEDGLDLSAQRDAKIEALFLRALRVPKTDTQTGSLLEIPIDSLRASKFLSFDANGKPIVAAGTSANLGPVSAYIDTLLPAATSAVARTTLGAVGLTGDETVAGIKAFTGANTFSGATTFTAGIGPNYLQNIGIAASVASKALTVALKTKALADASSTDPIQIAFRNVTLTTGDYVVRNVTAATSVVAPSGATLGFNASAAGNLYAYALDNAGTVEVILSGSNHWDEATVQSTTAISATADNGSVLYSTTARTNVPIRYIGRIKIQTGAVAGEWDNAPTEVHVGELSVRATSVRLLHINTTTVGNIDTGTDNLMSYTLPANTLNLNLKTIRITAWGRTTNNANAKTIALSFGGTTVPIAMRASIAGRWKITATFTRTASNAQTGYFDVNEVSSASTVAATFGAAFSGSYSITDTADIIIVITGAATTTNDIDQEGMLVELLN